MKAKAKRLDNGEWVEGYYELFLDHEKKPNHWMHCNLVRYEIDPSTLVFPELEEAKKEIERITNDSNNEFSKWETTVHTLEEQNKQLIEALNTTLNIENPYAEKKDFNRFDAAEYILDRIFRTKEFQAILNQLTVK